MTIHKTLNTQTYQHIGYLFYAVAAVDKIVDDKEIETLKLLVKDLWLDVDSASDDFGSDAAYQIEIVFDWLNEADWNSTTCYNKFENYFKAHSSQFNDATKSLIFKTALAIAESFAGKNKSELIILAKIEALLKSS